MALNYDSDGKYFETEVPADTPSGVPLMIGDMPVVTLTAADKNKNATVSTEGGWSLPAIGKVTVGQSLGLNPDGNLAPEITPHFGYALESNAAGVADIRVKVGR